MASCEQLAFAAYQAMPGINWSTLKELEKSERHYLWRRQHPLEDTARLAFGRLVHTAVLEREHLPNDYAAFEGDKRTKAWREFREANAGRTCVSAAEMDAALDMAEAVRSHPLAGRLIANCRAEVSLTWTDKATGIACKARLDALTPRTIVELKTVTSADPWEFGRVCARLGYHKQLAFQRRGVRAVLKRKHPAVRIIAVEIEPPYDVVVFRPDEDALWAADETIGDLLVMAERLRHKREPRGRSEKLVPLHLPPWAYGDEGEITDDITIREA